MESSPWDGIPRDPATGLEFLDFAAMRRKSDSWKDYWDEEQPYPANVLELVKASFKTNDEWLYPIITAYTIFPSALADRVPLLFFYGKAGSGKSTIGHLACKLHNMKARTANDTEAALRRILDNSRWLFSQTKEYEQNVLLVYEDLDQNVLAPNSVVYRLLKLGCDRLAGHISMAGENRGEVIEQFVFCPKILSSTKALFTLDPEIARRSLVIKTQPLEEVFAAGDVLGIHDLDWTGVEHELKRWWNNRDRVNDFVDGQAIAKKKLRRLRSADRAMLVDLSAVLLCSELVEEDRLLDYWNQYLSYREEVVNEGQSGVKTLLAAYLAEYRQKARTNPLMPHEGVLATVVDQAVEGWFQQKAILSKPRHWEMERIMNDLGYNLKSVNGKGFWVEI